MADFNKCGGDSVRFAPSTTGYAHPGTLLSGLLCWLDARSRGESFFVRLENLDPDRSSSLYEQAMLRDLAWFGLDWDNVIDQKAQHTAHAAAMDELASQSVLYACACSRSRLRALGRVAPDGGFAYDNHCRQHLLTPSAWRKSEQSLRVRLPDDTVTLPDETGIRFVQNPSRDMGDPVVRRRDGAMAYHLACVVDDAIIGVQRLIRGRDLASSAPTQIMLQRMLGYPTPKYYHHFLFLEHHHGKMAKLHGSVGAPELQQYYKPEALCGLIAYWSGITDTPSSCQPRELIPYFSWSRLRSRDLVVTWTGSELITMPERDN